MSSRGAGPRRKVLMASEDGFEKVLVSVSKVSQQIASSREVLKGSSLLHREEGSAVPEE